MCSSLGLSCMGLSGILGLGWLFPSHLREIFDYYLFKYFLMLFPFVFFFWDASDSNVGHITLPQRSLSLRLSSFLLFFFFFIPVLSHLFPLLSLWRAEQCPLVSFEVSVGLVWLWAASLLMCRVACFAKELMWSVLHCLLALEWSLVSV